MQYVVDNASCDNDHQLTTAVFAFGRFQPPTKGHEKLIKKVHSLAQQMNGDPYIFISPTTDSKGVNPLLWLDRVELMKNIMPWANIHLDNTVRDPWKVIEWLKKTKYNNVIFVAGSDRVSEYGTRWITYAQPFFKRVTVVDCGVRDPDRDGIAGLNATKAREFAMLDNSFENFQQAVGWEIEQAQQIYCVLKHRLRNGVVESGM